MYELKRILERYLRVNLLGQGPPLIKEKNLPGRGLTKVEKHCPRRLEPLSTLLRESQIYESYALVTVCICL